MNPQTISLTELQKHLDQTCKEKGWDKNSVTEVFLLFTEEVGELAKAVRKETGFKGEKKTWQSWQSARGVCGRAELFDGIGKSVWRQFGGSVFWEAQDQPDATVEIVYTSIEKRRCNKMYEMDIDMSIVGNYE